MTEDTDWLKKNPVKSFWRSSRFYGKDMDSSVMAHDQKSKNDILVVSHMPRRSNIPIEKIKQMDFRFPAPVSKKPRVATNADTKIPKRNFVAPQETVSRPSVSFRPGENKNGTQKQNLIKSIGRPSVLRRPSRGNVSLCNVKSGMVRRTPMVTRNLNQNSVKSAADLSLLSQSKVVNQSTPNETAFLRSILKQSQNGGGRTCSRNILDGKKPAAAKRVNFNGSVMDKCQEKENQDGTEEGNSVMSPLAEKKDGRSESDEESTVAFSQSFKPLPEEEVEDGSEANVEEEKEEEEEEEVAAAKDEDKNPSEEPSDSEYVNRLMDMWRHYQDRVSNIRSELQSVDESFQRTLESVMNNELGDELSAYEEEKFRLYEKLKDLETEFRESVRNCTEVKKLFLSYLERKKDIFSVQARVEEDFEKALRGFVEKRGTGAAEEGDLEDNRGTKKSKRVSGGKRKSECISGGRTRSTPRKRSSRTSGGSTPDNTPARRRKLSRKIEKQIRNLFEE